MFRITAFIENDMYVRNFITSGAFDGLLEREGFTCCVSEIVQKLRNAIPPEHLIGQYQRHRDNIALVYQFNKVSMLALQEKSSTFALKSQARWMGDYRIEDRVLAASDDFDLSRQFFLNQFKENGTLEALIRQTRPHLVLFPVTGVEATGTELVLLSRKYHFKTFFLVNGWDNLSSKGVFPLLPDYLGVWGPQALVDAVEIQGMPPARTVLLGCARYEAYLDSSNTKTRPIPGKYILFAGATAPVDEITPLRMLDEVLEEKGIEDIQIVYRPHPWREKRNCPDRFDPEDFRHIILDPQVTENYYSEKTKGTESVSSTNFPELDYYPSLLNHALFVISPMSSMTLEAALFDVPSLVLAHDDGCHPMPPSAIARFRHFEGTEETPGWFFVRSLAELKPRFHYLLDHLCNEEAEHRRYRPVLSHATQPYLFRNGKSYAQNLEETVGIIETLESSQGFSSSPLPWDRPENILQKKTIAVREP